jgi:glycosyltransferase involved in cell wall biosynthesis
MSRARLGIVVTHPIQYQVPLYRYLTENSTVEPHVFFLTDYGVAASYDPGFGRDVHYDVPLLDGYDYEFVTNRSPKPSPGTPWGTFNPSLPRAIRKASVDALLVHGYSNASAWLAFGTAVASRVPYLLRGDSRPDAAGRRRAVLMVKRRLIGPLVRHAGACLAVGSENRDFYLQFGASPSRVFHTPYSIDTERFEASGDIGRKSRHERLESLGLDPAKPVVLFAAKLQSWKRPLDVVGATDRLQGAVNLVIVGDGPLRDELDARASTRPWMRVLGFVNQTEIAEWYGVADLFVLPSDSETWGLAVNEAMAAGALPIVSDSVGCAPDLVTPDIGWVYETGNISALAHAISEGCPVADSDDRRAAARRRSSEWGIAATALGIEQAMATLGNR